MFLRGSMATTVRKSIIIEYYRLLMIIGLIIVDDLPNDTNDISMFPLLNKHLFIFMYGQLPIVTQSGERMTVELSNTKQPASGKRTSIGQLPLGTHVPLKFSWPFGGRRS